MMDRTFTPEVNAIVIEKALRYQNRGIVGIDIAGPPSPDFSYHEHQALVERARAAGLGVTIHTGEEGRVDDMWEVVEHLRPQRIGHGILCVYDVALVERVAQEGITLEICPTSNLRTKAVRDIEELRHIITTLKERGVPFTINTDGPEMLVTNLVKEYQLLLDQGIFDDDDVRRCIETAKRASFLTAREPARVG
jgi:adenosine deaminase